jgi:epsilon-lactone hydrolase
MLPRPRLLLPKVALPSISPELRTATRVAVQMNNAAAQAVVSTGVHYATRTRRGPSWTRSYEGIVEFLARSFPHHAVPVADLRAAMDSVTHLPMLHPVAYAPDQVGGVPALWVGAPHPSGRIVLYLHGGGYCTGSPRTHLGLTGEIARTAQARVLAPDYRLAPEAPFPAAVEDAWAAYWGLLAQGIPPQQIVVMGDSAGGGLTVALLVALRDAGMPLPAAAVCLSPWLDLCTSCASLHANARCDYLNEPIIRVAVQMYLGDADPHTPLASPLYADLHGLPPLLIQVGTAEMLLDDSTRFARRAVQAGVLVELELWENMVHVWHFFHPIDPQAQRAIRRIGAFVRAHTATEAWDG